MSEYIITDEQIAENQRLHGKKLLVMPVIVRCRDCRRFHPKDGSLLNCRFELYDGLVHWRYAEPDGFCAWGERKEVDG